MESESTTRLTSMLNGGRVVDVGAHVVEALGGGLLRLVADVRVVDGRLEASGDASGVLAFYKIVRWSEAR